MLIYDNVFDEETRKWFAKFDYTSHSTYKPNHPSKWYNLGENQMFEKLIELAKPHFDLSEMSCYELWANGHPLDWHVDKNERKRAATGEHEHALCTILYYAEIRNLSGGEFLTKNVRYIPLENRVVMFSSGVPHKVNSFEGKRVAITINPWKDRYYDDNTNIS